MPGQIKRKSAKPGEKTGRREAEKEGKRVGEGLRVAQLRHFFPTPLGQ